jgi:hypothetical protein
VLVPSGHERVGAGDVLAVAGAEDAVAAARELIVGSVDAEELQGEGDEGGERSRPSSLLTPSRYRTTRS